MKKNIIILLLVLVPSLLMAQTSGGTIKRPNQKKQSIIERPSELKSKGSGHQAKSKLDLELENCSYERAQICDDNYDLCYYITYPSFLTRSYPNDDNEFKNVFRKNNDLKIETWELWNHIEVDYDCNDVYNLLKSSTDTIHSIKSKEVIVRGIFVNGKKYYTKAVFDKDDNVIYARMTYSNNLSTIAEKQLIKQVFDSFPK